MSEDKQHKKLWDNISDDDFRNEGCIEEDDIAQYDLEKMKIFSANINYFRQILRLSDSLKPVERRILYSMYLSGAKPGTKTQKSQSIVGNVMKLHSHGECYPAMVNMAQPWKKAAPLVMGKGNFGNIAYPDMYAAPRYTEALMSKYAYECFFEDYDPECVELIESTASDGFEPMSLPSKFPNALVNGGTGIAVGNSFCIPPYNINDIVNLTKKLLQNPDYPNVFMIPDLPSGCQVVDDGTCFKEICDTGSGVLRMRANTNIFEQGKYWAIQVTSIPWLSSLTVIHEALTQATKKGALPIKDIQDKSYPVHLQDGTVRTVIDYRILIDKNHDPYKIRDKILSSTDLEKSMSVKFKVVLDSLTLGQLSMRELILEWIDGRREYKRRLLNKKIVRITARISLLEILIHLLDKDNIEKTVGIIKDSNSDEVVDRLRRLANMSSYQATKIADMRLNAFTKDARARYIQEKDKLTKDLAEIMELIKSEKKIDNIIMTELDDLKKYGFPRRSEVVSATTQTKIPDTDHVLIFTKQDNIKKMNYYPLTVGKAPVLGSFKPSDYPTKRVIANNHDNLIMFDSLGKFSRIPVYEIESTEANSTGNAIYDVTKLNGHIVTVSPDFNVCTQQFVKDKLNTNIYLVTLSKSGLIKKTELSEFTDGKISKNSRAMRLKDDDELIYAGVIMDTSVLMIYTKNGEFTLIPASEISIQGRNTLGTQLMKIEDNDECAGLSVISPMDEYIVVITEKGSVKKCEIQSMKLNKRGVSSYLATVEPNDAVQFADGIKDSNRILVCTRQSYMEIKAEDIPTLARRAKCRKMIPVPQGSSIIAFDVK